MKRKRKKLKIKNVFLLLIIIFIMVSLSYFLANVKVRGFYIKGNKYYSDDEILKMTNLNSDSSFLFNTSSLLTNKVKNNKIIKKIKLKRNLFFEYTLIVDENRILYKDGITNKYILEDGNSVSLNSYNAPVLINKIENKKILKKFLMKLNKIDDNSLSIISEIKYDPNYIDKERMLLSMNDGNYVYLTLSKFKSIKNYSKIVRSLGEKKGILYLDYGNYFLSQ